MEKNRGHDEGFLGRWSRLKTDAREAAVQPPVESQAPVEAKQPVDTPPELPPVDTLTLDSDFRGFLHPTVDEDLRRSALRKLFSDPHFNVMDGLDVYIDDYSVSEPIPPEMLAGMKQAQRILRWAEGHDDEEEGEEKPEEKRDEANVDAAAAPAPDAAAPPAALDYTPAEPSVALQAADPLPQQVSKSE